MVSVKRTRETGGKVSQWISMHIRRANIIYLKRLIKIFNIMGLTVKQQQEETNDNLDS